MSTDLATTRRRGRAATPAVAAGSALEAYSDEQVQLLKTQLVGADSDGNPPSDLELAYFGQVAQRLGLDPFRNQITAQLRRDSRAPGGRKLVIVTTIDGYRAVAHRTGDFAGEDPPEWCGADGAWRQVWLEDSAPAAARQTVYRKGSDRGFTAVVTYREFCQKDRQGNPISQWRTMPSHMLAKCAEAGALRKAFQEAFDGVYSDAELGSADVIEASFVDEPTRARVEATVDANTVQPAAASQRQSPPAGPPAANSAPAPSPTSSARPAQPPPAATPPATATAAPGPTAQQLKDETESFSRAETDHMLAWCRDRGVRSSSRTFGQLLAETGKATIRELVDMPDFSQPADDTGEETSTREAGDAGAQPPQPAEETPGEDEAKASTPATGDAEGASRTTLPAPPLGGYKHPLDRVTEAFLRFKQADPDAATEFGRLYRLHQFAGHEGESIVAQNLLDAFGEQRTTSVDGLVEILETLRGLPDPATPAPIDNARIRNAMITLDSDQAERLERLCTHIGIRFLPSDLGTHFREAAYDLPKLITNAEKSADFQAYLQTLPAPGETAENPGQASLV